MAWRAPRYCFLHAARAAGVAALTPSPAAAATGPKDFLIDDRAGSLFAFGSSSSSARIDLDRSQLLGFDHPQNLQAKVGGKPAAPKK